jgi:hypothetical protein
MRSRVIFFAVVISASTLYTLVGTQISGARTAEKSSQDKLDRWNFTVQWSIPKLESLRVIIPGIFGYRMADYTTSSDKSGVYWGSVAEDPLVEELESNDPEIRAAAAASPHLNLSSDVQAIISGGNIKARQGIVDQIKESGMLQRRHSGNGEYAGALVCLLAVFGVASGARKAKSPFSPGERRLVWFWSGAAVFSLLAAWGQHGFVYGFIYHLPFLANIRSPMKFMHPLNISLIILCGFGLEALHRNCLQPAAKPRGNLISESRARWKMAATFDKSWAAGTVGFAILAAAAWLAARLSKAAIIGHIERAGFDSVVSPQIAGFCIGELAIFIVYFTLSAAAILFILSGNSAGSKIVWAWVFLSATMICDLSRADLPWVRYYNYQEKYSANPVVDVLRREPWEHRVVSRFSPTLAYYDIAPDANWGKLCHWWLENDYPYNDIQSLELDQAPRLPALDENYIGNFTPRSAKDLSPAALQWVATHPRDNPFWNWVAQSGPAARLWRLTNTRYIFGDARLAEVLNQFAEPPGSFRTVLRADMVAKPGVKQIEDFGDVTVQTNSQGPMALMEFTDALPRASLYSSWRVVDDPTALQILSSREFDPAKAVLVSKDTPVPQPAASPGVEPGTAKIARYQAKDTLVETNSKTSAVLLLNDRTGQDWTVTVDKKPAKLLRCNYIMRGVLVPPGAHTVEFRFQPPIGFLWVSVTAFALGIVLAGHIVWARFWAELEPPDRWSEIWTGPTPTAT